MAKCIAKNGTVKRVSDRDAHLLVGLHDWEYVSKSEANKLDKKFFTKKFERLQKSK
jgi:uncharacterized short protein YbdD (DUF466 family)